MTATWRSRAYLYRNDTPITIPLVGRGKGGGRAETPFRYTCGRMWTVQSIDPPDAALLFRLLPGTLKTMGRAPRADFVVDAPLVSRVHCRFVLGPDNTLSLEDLGSTNGTFVNGQKAAKAVLADGDKVTVGRVLFSVTRQA